MRIDHPLRNRKEFSGQDGPMDAVLKDTSAVTRDFLDFCPIIKSALTDPEKNNPVILK